MHRIDTSAWPLAVFEFEGVQGLAEHQASLRHWDMLFSRGECFVVVRLFHDEDSLVHPQDAGRVTKQWLRDGAAALIRDRVTAMLNVVPPAAYPRMKDLSVEAVFGVPGGVFDSVAAVATWLEARLGLALQLPARQDRGRPG